MHPSFNRVLANDKPNTADAGNISIGSYCTETGRSAHHVDDDHVHPPVLILPVDFYT